MDSGSRCQRNVWWNTHRTLWHAEQAMRAAFAASGATPRRLRPLAAPIILGPDMSTRAKLLWLTVWALAFGVLEGAVVTYLRRLFYAGAPLDAPLFPLRAGEPAVLVTEIAREAATLVMLAGVAMLAERRAERRFAAFALCFGLWDLGYYAMLWVAIGWPTSLMEWDILFMIPAPWASPVLAPVLVSLALVACSVALLSRDEHAPALLGVRDWWGLVGCGAVILATFFTATPAIARGEVPAHYAWWLFLAGWLGGLALWTRAWRQRQR